MAKLNVSGAVKTLSTVAPAAAGVAVGSMATSAAGAQMFRAMPSVMASFPELLALIGVGGGLVGQAYVKALPKTFWQGMMVTGLLTGAGLAILRVTESVDTASKIGPAAVIEIADVLRPKQGQVA